MTFYEDPDGGTLTGCMVKGVRRLSEALGHYGIDVTEDGKLRIRMVFWAYTLLKSNEPAQWPDDFRERFANLVKESEDLVADRAVA